jgi:hypothetical protein
VFRAVVSIAAGITLLVACTSGKPAPSAPDDAGDDAANPPPDDAGVDAAQEAASLPPFGPGRATWARATPEGPVVGLAVGPGGDLLATISTGDGYYTLARYDAEGNQAWSRTLKRQGALDLCTVSDAQFDASGNIVVTGYVNGACAFGGGANVTANRAAYVAKYDATVNFTWIRTFEGGGDASVAATSSGRSVAATANGDVVATGDFLDTIDLGGGPLTGTYAVPPGHVGARSSWRSRARAPSVGRKRPDAVAGSESGPFAHILPAESYWAASSAARSVSARASIRPSRCPPTRSSHAWTKPVQRFLPCSSPERPTRILGRSRSG